MIIKTVEIRIYFIDTKTKQPAKLIYDMKVVRGTSTEEILRRAQYDFNQSCGDKRCPIAYIDIDGKRYRVSKDAISTP